jgi:cobalt-zinc-cadmium efflux system outer membrane protein
MSSNIRLPLCLLLLTCCSCKSGAQVHSDSTALKIPAEPAVAKVEPTAAPLEVSALDPQVSETTKTESSSPEIQEVSLTVSAADSDDDQLSPPPAYHNSLNIYETISQSLVGNPALVALRETENVGVSAVGVAETYPFNPWVQVQATPGQYAPDGKSAGSTYHYVLMMQQIQLAHQQQYREDAAYSSLNSIRWNIHQSELQTTSMTAQLYYTLLYRRGLLEIARASQDNNSRLLQALTKRFEAGDLSAADLATVRIDTRSTSQQLRLAEANYQTALRNLRNQLGLDPASPVDFRGDLRDIHWRMPNAETAQQWQPEVYQQQIADPSDEKAWIASWAACRPDVQVAHADIDVASANLNLASANKVPDLIIGPYYQKDASSLTHYGLRAQMDIPVLNTGRPLERQRMSEFNQKTTVWRQTLLRAELEAQAAYERYKVAYELYDRERGLTSNELPQELQSLEKQFEIGEVDVVRIIQARTSILQNQRAHLDLVNELAQSAALLVGASGMPLELMVAP